ncbi:MAG: hypothetical protein E7676_06090 [Ruminococcaceae bacterium]|nr:hypothetical protein [Oscillospiraceae bacterium]
MVRIDAIIFGYRKISVSPDMISVVSSRFIRAGIISSIDGDGKIIVRERDIKKAREILSGISFEESKMLGLLGAIKRLKHKKAILISSLIGAIIVFLASSLVWDIRIDGNDSLTDAQITEALSESNFSVGDVWLLCDRSRIESDFLRNLSEISWININKRGTVAYVSVMEKNSQNDTENEHPEGYANLVASCDCIIEEITVISGTPQVKAGDVVKKGDVLILGLKPIESGGGLCYAEGRVIGRMSEEVSVEVEREHEVRRVERKKLSEININFFNFSINIFKLYGNSVNGCDIIKNIKVFSLFGEKRLPFSISTSYVLEYDSTPESYDDTQIVKIASERLSVKMLSLLSDADLVKIKTDGRYTDKGYQMRSQILLTREVAEASPIVLN